VSTAAPRSEPSISVILPTFNRLEYLRPAVESVFAQTYRDWELLIVDDGSDDVTRAYLSSLTSEARVRLLWLEHCGNPGAVRNAALRQARGEYVAFIDSDDLWEPEKLELQVAALRAHPSDQWGYTAFNHVNESGELILPHVSPSRVHGGGRVFEHLLDSKIAVATPTVIARRQLIERAGGFDERRAQQEDYHLWLRLAMLSEARPLERPLARVRHHSDHFSNRGPAGLEDKERMLEDVQARAETPKQRAAVRAARARNAAQLASGNASAGRRDAAWSVLASSWRFSWRYGSWWLGATKALTHLCAPARLTLLIREYLRNPRHTPLR